MRTNIILFIFIITIVLNIKAQVTIGSGTQPETGALLHLKQTEAMTQDEANATKGLLLPRVMLSNKTQLFPMFLQDPSNPESGATSEYNDEKETIDAAHTGLIVYNIKEELDKDLCLGLNQWDGKEWNCFQSKMGEAITQINCNSITVHGNYLNDVPLDASNYITLDLSVTKPGAYTITATPKKGNGYYFNTNGVFLAVGDYAITVQGAGTPTEYTSAGDNGDLIEINVNGNSIDNCDPLYIKVGDSSVKPIYSMDCSLTTVKGVYRVDQELSPVNNYLEITLNVDIAAIGASYIIETNTVDGIYFKGQGELTNAPIQTVKIAGFGTPNSVDQKVLTITTNSAQTTATCRATVVVTIPKKKILHLGSVDTSPGYLAQPGSGAHKMITASNNFGIAENSTVKLEAFESQLITGAPNAAMINAVKAKPDILLIGYYFTWSGSSSSAFIAAVKDYLNAGGVLLMLDQHPNDQDFLRSLYGKSDISSGLDSTPYQYVYQLPDGPEYLNDPIVNGPFGDMRAKHWGADVGDLRSLQNMPSNLIVYSRGKNGGVTFFRDPNVNFIYNGEGGFLANPSGCTGDGCGVASSTTYPFAIDSSLKPIPRINWASRADVYNSTIFANMMAWAIERAQNHGINTPK